MPCGAAGERCIEDQAYCKAETDVFSGMKWAKNGQSLLLRCCSISGAQKLYIGTDLVALGSYYTGGIVPSKDMSAKDGGPEYDFVTNVRTEQGGVRVWVYRIVCPLNASTQPPQSQQVAQGAAVVNSGQKGNAGFEERRQYLLKQIAESQDGPTISIDSQTNSGQPSGQPQPQSAVEPAAQVDAQPEAEPSNPLQYRPRAAQRMRDSPTGSGEPPEHMNTERLL